jgi:dethiobiotin synthetase
MLEPRRSLLVVTGTDTGVGKTHVSRAILRALARSDSPAFPLKLIETGCLRHDGVLVPDDGLALARAAGREEALPDVAPFRFELPAAPATAARHAGTTLPFSALVAAVERAHGHAPRVLLEGAGGLLVPLGPEGTFADLCVRLRPRVLLVARDALGTLNHTLLTAEALARRGLVLAAVVLNATGPEPCTLDHARELAEHLPGVPIVGPLPWQPGATDDQLANALAHAGLDPTRLAATLFADRG